MEKQRIFIDMDGTLAEFKTVDTLEMLYEKGYFENLYPQHNVVDAVKRMAAERDDIEVFVLSSVLSDSKYALNEKNMWLDTYLPEIDATHRIFPPCGENKLDYLPGGFRETDYLLDDYTNNLTLWEPPAKGIKLLNGINHTKETWKGSRLRYDKSADELYENIIDVMVNKNMICDPRPQEVSLGDTIQKMEEHLRDLQELNQDLKTKLPDRQPEVRIEQSKSAEFPFVQEQEASDNEYLDLLEYEFNVKDYTEIMTFYGYDIKANSMDELETEIERIGEETQGLNAQDAIWSFEVNDKDEIIANSTPAVLVCDGNERRYFEVPEQSVDLIRKKVALRSKEGIKLVPEKEIDEPKIRI